MLQPLIAAIDDENDELLFLRHLLQKTAFAHRFQPFGNGEAALSGFASLLEHENSFGLPVICFLDGKMPAMSGFDVLRSIREKKALDGVSVFMLSSSDDPNDVDRAREFGAQGYLRKYPSAAAMQTILDEASEFALLGIPRKTFVQWNYRFVESCDAVPAK
jgi:CheY-like chemotaxis protein